MCGFCKTIYNEEDIPPKDCLYFDPESETGISLFSYLSDEPTSAVLEGVKHCPFCGRKLTREVKNVRNS